MPFDHELKLRRAHTHLEELQGRCGLYVNAAIDTFSTEPHPEMPGHVRGWINADSPPRDPLALIIGDCLQNLRSGLDHLALELATSFSAPLSDEVTKRSEFPIFGDEQGDGSKRFHQLQTKGSKAGLPAVASGVSKTQGMDPAAQKIIERLQPYHRGQAYATDPLWRIHELNRIDKHRLLHTAVAMSGGPALHVTPDNGPELIAALNDGGFVGVLDVAHGEVHGRTYIGAWPAGTTEAGKKMSAAWRPRLDITFEKSVPLVSGEPVLETLSCLYNYILTDVLPPLVGFLK